MEKVLPGSWGPYLSHPPRLGTPTLLRAALVVTPRCAEGLGTLLAPPRTRATADISLPADAGRWVRGDLCPGSGAGHTMSLWATPASRAAPGPQTRSERRIKDTVCSINISVHRKFSLRKWKPPKSLGNRSSAARGAEPGQGLCLLCSGPSAPPGRSTSRGCRRLWRGKKSSGTLRYAGAEI